MTIHRLRVVTAVVICAAALVAGHAAGLGGVNSSSISAWSYPADIQAGGPVACASFNLPNGNLAGSPVGCGGGAWSVVGGNWNILDGQVKATAQTSIATVGGPSPYVSVQATVIDANKANRLGGLIVSYDATNGSYLGAVIVGPNRVELRSVSPTGTTVLGSAAISIGGTATLRLTRTSTTATVTVTGATVTTVTAAVPSNVLPGTGAGLYHGGGPSITFDDFLLELATPP